MKRKEFEYMNYIRSHVKVYGKVAYSILNRDVYEKFGLVYTEAKEKVYALIESLEDIDDVQEVYHNMSE